MKTQTLIQVSGMILLAVAVSLAVLTLVYAVQNLHLWAGDVVASIGWNG